MRIGGQPASMCEGLEGLELKLERMKADARVPDMLGALSVVCTTRTR